VDAATHQRDIWTVSPDGGTPIRLTSDTANDMSPSWSPDGRYLYFASDRGGALNLWRLEIDGSGRAAGPPQPVTMPNSNAVHPTFSADGRHVAYATYTWHASVFAVPFDPVKLEVQGPPVSLVRGPHLWTGPRISPDGGQLAVVRWGQQLDLFIGRSDGTQLRRATSDPLGVRCPEWSPDGTRIAYMRNLQSDGGVLILDVRTGDVRRVDTSGIGPALTCPSWSPDGKRLAIGQGPPREGAYVLTLSTGDGAASAERLPESSEGAFMPRTWSPDGQWLAGTVGNRMVIYSLSARQYTMLTERGSAVSASPAPWLPDGRHILFLSPALDIYAVHSGTKAVKRILSVTPERLHGFSVSRDGRRLFYGQGPEEGDIWLGSWPGDR
jgi:Tol biopolymer transport system component